MVNIENGNFFKVNWAIPETGGSGHTFFKKTLEFFMFFTLPMEILDKTKFHPWKFHKILLDPLENSTPKNKTPENSTFFLGHPWKFHFIFN